MTDVLFEPGQRVEVFIGMYTDVALWRKGTVFNAQYGPLHYGVKLDNGEEMHVAPRRVRAAPDEAPWPPELTREKLWQLLISARSSIVSYRRKEGLPDSAPLIESIDDAIAQLGAPKLRVIPE